jgi:hypothetical protein
MTDDVQLWSEIYRVADRMAEASSLEGPGVSEDVRLVRAVWLAIRYKQEQRRTDDRPTPD